MIEKQDIQKAGFSGWKEYAESIHQNPSNFKRQLFKKINQLNSWISPLNLQILIAPKGENGEEKRKEKDFGHVKKGEAFHNSNIKKLIK